MFFVNGVCRLGSSIFLPSRSSTCLLNSGRPISSIVYLSLHISISLQGFVPSVLPVLAISIVTLDKHDRFADFGNFLRSTETKKLTETGVGLFIAVGHTHTSADEDVETG